MFPQYMVSEHQHQRLVGSQLEKSHQTTRTLLPTILLLPSLGKTYTHTDTHTHTYTVFTSTSRCWKDMTRAQWFRGGGKHVNNCVMFYDVLSHKEETHTLFWVIATPKWQWCLGSFKGHGHNRNVDITDGYHQGNPPKKQWNWNLFSKHH